jgi:hypothetical protein
MAETSEDGDFSLSQKKGYPYFGGAPDGFDAGN